MALLINIPAQRKAQEAFVKALNSDSYIKECLKNKIELLGSVMPTYILDNEGLKTVYPDAIVASLNKIDYLIDARKNQILSHYKL